MKLLCLINLILMFNIKLNSESFAFYYGVDFSNKNSELFENIVVIPENISKEYLDKNLEKIFAYISISETNIKIPKDIIIGENKQWNTKVGDLRKKEYRDIIINKVKKLRENGFKNFFLDTIDSYLIVLKEKKDIKEYEDYLVEIIKQIKQDNADSKIIINRGFEIMDRIKPYVDYIVAESLYYGFDKEKKYIKISENETNWLKNQLFKAKNLGYKVIVIDYIPQNLNKERIEIARKIKNDGFIPYISNIELNEWGSNEYEKINRTILVFYDSSKVNDIIYSQAHRLVQMPLEYLGYKAEIVDINNLNTINEDDYYAVIFATENDNYKKPDELIRWIKKQINKGKKILFLGEIPLPKDSYYFKDLKIKIKKNLSDPGEKNKLLQSSYKNFEIPFNYYYSNYIFEAEDCKPVVVFENSKGQKHYQAAITKWGGYALNEGWITKMSNFELHPLNPFEFFKEALELKDIPVMDPTTENGRRILITHVDGDGFNSIYEQDTRYYASEILKKEIIEKYKIPHSISIIRGDIDREDIPKEKKERFIKIANDIFSMSNVEMANHSYSHPFKWIDIKEDYNLEHITQIYNINIPNYNFDITEEIIGTKKWLEETFKSSNKKNNIFFWTGDCIAPYYALKILNENNILNINGGYTIITKDMPYISLISPLGIKRQEYYQIFTGQQNENIYTNLWTGPFWGYKKSKETFELTESPLRLKPINIYYHFYSASKYESLNALKYIYDYALTQKTNPQFVSEYVKKVLDFYNYELYSYENNWLIISNSEIKTIRINKDLYPQIIDDSSLGYQSINNNNYIHLKGQSPYKILLTNKKPEVPYLKESNAKVLKFEYEKNNLYIKLSSIMPIEYSLNNVSNCQIIEKNEYKSEVYLKEIYGKCK